MAPANKAEAVAELARVWGDGPETHIGIAILDLVASNLDNAFLPLSLFFEAGDSVQSDNRAAVLNVVSFFAGASAQLLTLKLEYIDDDEVILLDDDAAKAASEESINPITGEKDSEVQSKLFVCFTPSDVARRALRK